jgi:hypothetical protein
MQECPNGHPLSVVGRLTVRWCPEDGRFLVKAWVADETDHTIELVTPEWAWPHELQDDEWRDRTLTKHVTTLANLTRKLEDDIRHGVARLL